MSDIFREVDEDLQRKQMKRLWDRYGYYVIASAVLIVVLTAGYKGWQSYKASVAATQGDAFLTAVERSESGDTAAAKADFDTLIADGSAGYALLAKFRAASDLAASGDREAALAAFEGLSRDKALEPFQRDLARIRAAYLAVDLEDFDAMNARVSDLAASANPLRFSAREILGLSAWKAEKLEAARARFVSLRDDSETPAELRQRAEFMLSLLQSRMPADAAAPDAAATKTQ